MIFDPGINSQTLEFLSENGRPYQLIPNRIYGLHGWYIIVSLGILDQLSVESQFNLFVN